MYKVLNIGHFFISIEGWGINSFPEYFDNFYTENINQPVDIFLKVSNEFKAEYRFTGDLVYEAESDNSNWYIFKNGSDFIFTESKDKHKISKYLVAVNGFKEWLFISRDDENAFFSYPFDSLFLQYGLLSLGAVTLHASCVYKYNNGLLFVGRSGRGKSTLARMFYENGYNVLHDDKIVLYESNGEIWAANLPKYDLDSCKSCKVSSAFMISGHGKNTIEAISNNDLLTNLLANGILHNFNNKLVYMTVRVFASVVDSVKGFELYFTKTKEIIKNIEKTT